MFWNPSRLRMRIVRDAKYGCLTRGGGCVYLRMPTGTGYQTKIWVG